MKKKKMDREDQRQLVLDVAAVIAEKGVYGIRMGDLVNEMKVNHNEINTIYLKNTIIKVLLKKCLGNIIQGEKAQARYIIDSLDIAVKLINDYFDRGMTPLEMWRLIKDICEYINSKDESCYIEEVADEFGIEMEFIDKVNSELTKYAVGFDFYKQTHRGTKVKVNENAMSVINNMITDLESKEPVKSSPRKDSTKGEDVKLKVLDEETRRRIQLRLVEIIYQKDSMSQGEISRIYFKMYGDNLKYSVIESMLKKVPGIGHKSDQYWIKDIKDAVFSIDPFKSRVKLEIAVKKGMSVGYSNMKKTLELTDYDVYILEDDNSYDLIIQLLDLIVSGVSVNESIREIVMSIVIENMKTGKKVLL